MLYPGNGKPLFEQLADLLLQMIERGEYKEGDLLPSERQLSERYAISRVTVRQALDALVRDGVIVKKQGKGNLVATKRIETRLDSLLGFVEEFTIKKMKCEVSVLFEGYQKAPAEVTGPMEFAPDTEMFLLIRRIIVDGQTLGMDYTYIPKNIGYLMGKMDFEHEIIYRKLEQTGYKLSYAEQNIVADLPTAEECEVLHIKAKSPVLALCRVAYVEGGLPIMYSRTVYRGDRYRYTLTLNRYPVHYEALPDGERPVCPDEGVSG